MTQEWEDILSEPIAGLQPDLPAANGGWRGVQTIEELSPRPQDPPVSLPDPELMLAVRRPVQPEEPSPASAPPPPTLTEQLSLTWAARRQPRPRTVEETGPTWPEWELPSAEAHPPEEPRQPVPAWKRPLEFLTNFVQRRPQTSEAPAPSPEARPGEPREATVQPAPRLSPPSSSDEPGLPAAPRRQSVDAPPVDLTLARAAPEHATEPEAGAVPPLTAASTELSPKSAAIEPAPSEEKAERRLQPEQLLAETNRTRVQPEEESADERVERPFEPVPLVDRASPTGQPAEPEQTPEEKADASDTGDPLSPVLQQRMERLLDVPLRDVRIFRNSVSRRATQSHQADAVTIGNDVHLAPDRGEPSAPSGQALLAHELSHVAARRADALLPEAEETHAQALEHAVARQPDLGRPSQPTPVALEHRAAPPRSSATADALAGPAAYTSVLPSPGGSAAGSASAGGAAAVATAPTDRIVSGARTTAMAPDLLRNDDLMPPTEDEKPEERDEAGLVDRVVDAVLRRLKRDGALERERRGPFRSEIGG